MARAARSPYQDSMCISLPAAPQASQASLRADQNYINLLAAESGWPFQYNMSRPNPTTSRAFPVQGLVRSSVGPSDINTYNGLLPVHYRVAKRASQNRPQTELVGRAPYTALGRGLAYHVDDNSALMHGNSTSRDTSRAQLSESTWDRRQFVAMPSDLADLPTELRFGEMTRTGPSYAQPHDD